MRMFSFVLFFISLTLFSPHLLAQRLGVRLELKDPEFNENDLKEVTTDWFQQQLDHFDPTTANLTWQQRYFMNNMFFNKSGPVFLMIGGEGPASPGWTVAGSWIIPAKKLGALIIYLEHRYYGNSQPVSDISSDNLKYLNSQQALADTAYFIEGMKKKYKLDNDNKWIIFGGSYAGNLAAWIRVKYPHLVHAAVSSSAPLLAKVDFKEYYEVVAQSLATHSKSCPKAVAAANHALEKMVKYKKGRNQIKKLFRLCKPPNHKNKKDMATLFEGLAVVFAVVVQYNHRQEGSRLVNITTVCEIMNNRKLGNPVKRYATVYHKLFSGMHNCLDYEYKKTVQTLQETAWNSTAAHSSYRQWLYQTCTEYGYYQTSSTKKSVFSSMFPVSFFEKMCEDIYGIKFNKEVLHKGVYRTNIIFGELNIKASRIVHVHGSIDPWHALGVINSTNPDQPSIFIQGTSHCSNMYPPLENDPPQLTAARFKINELIEKWLKE